MKNRVGYYDIAKGIGIILVIIAHIEYMPLELRQYIVTFHMPAFFIISGTLMHLTKETGREIKPLLAGKFKRIMLPYLIFSVVYPVTYYLRFLITGDGYSGELFIRDILVGLSMTGISVLWFLPALFFSEVIVLIVLKSLKKPVLFVLCLLLLLGLWFLPLFVTFMGLFIWRMEYCCVLVLIGYVLLPVTDRLKDRTVLLLPISVILFIVLYFTGIANDIVDLHYIVLGNKFLYYLNATMGSLGLILLSIFMEKILKTLSPALQFFGRHSLFIMLTHIDFMILYMAERLAFAVSGVVPRGKEIVLNLTATIATLTAETILIIFWEKLKKCGILIYGDFIKSKE